MQAYIDGWGCFLASIQSLHRPLYTNHELHWGLPNISHLRISSACELFWRLLDNSHTRAVTTNHHLIETKPHQNQINCCQYNYTYWYTLNDVIAVKEGKQRHLTYFKSYTRSKGNRSGCRGNQVRNTIHISHEAHFLKKKWVIRGAWRKGGWFYFFCICFDQFRF